MLSFNSHKIRTENNKTPTQLRTIFADMAKDPPDINEDDYGVEDLDDDDDGNVDDDDEHGPVNLEPRVNPLGVDAFAVLREEAPPATRAQPKSSLRATFIHAKEVLRVLLEVEAGVELGV